MIDNTKLSSISDYLPAQYFNIKCTFQPYTEVSRCLLVHSVHTQALFIFTIFVILDEGKIKFGGERNIISPTAMAP